jgi:hypothetical protein
MRTAQELRAEGAAIYRQEYRAVLAGLTPNCDGARYSGKQRDYARGEAGRRATVRIERLARLAPAEQIARERAAGMDV